MGLGITDPVGGEPAASTLTRAQAQHRPPSHAERVERWQSHALTEPPKIPVGPCGGLMLGSGMV